MTTMLAHCDTQEETALPPLIWPDVPQTNFEREVSSDSPVVLNVLTLYSASVASEYGRFIAFLHDLLGEGAELRGTALALDDLRKSPPSLDPGSQSSDVVVLITREEELPVEVRQWFASWLKQAHADSAVICLLADGIYCESCTWHGLHKACDTAGVAFFATGFKADAVATPHVHGLAPVVHQACCP